VGLGAVLVILRGRPAASAEGLAARALQAIKAGQWAQARSRLDALARLRRPTASDRLLRAEVERNLDRPGAALAVLSQVPDGDPLAAQARLAAAQIERQRGRMRHAEAALLKALRLDPELIQARRELVFLYGMQARRAELNEQLRALDERTRLNYNELFIWTVSNVNIWINEAIRDDLERYLAADPEDRGSRRALAEVLLRAGDLDGCETILAPLPRDDLDARALRARVALDRSRLGDAEALLAGGPAEHAALARVRGQLAVRRNDLPEAARQFRIAARLDPTNLEVAQALALTLNRQGQGDEAIQARAWTERLRTLAGLLERAHGKTGRADRTLPRQLGDACAAIGQYAEARGWYRMAIDLDPLDAEAQRALYRLRETPAPGERVGEPSA
jgi:tetratricopeptide (TPR) repeat protein